jgi:hypothetical protein
MGLLLVLAACDEAQETTWEQFNAEDNYVTVDVGPACDPEPCADVTADLTSSTGSEVIGSGTVSPGGGPIGTEHRVALVVLDEYEAEVGRASVRTSSGARGEDEYDLDQDSADEGTWVFFLESVGDEGEVREDTFTFRLWKEVPVEDSGAIL